MNEKPDIFTQEMRVYMLHMAYDCLDTARKAYTFGASIDVMPLTRKETINLLANLCKAIRVQIVAQQTTLEETKSLYEEKGE